MLVIGNGESRKDIDLPSINEITIGCNAIYRDFNVHHLVCADKRMVNEALDLDANLTSLIYTREEYFKRFKTKRLREVPALPYAGMERPDQPIHWGSGPYAVLLGARLTKDSNVKLLGFDLYSKDGKTNNIYKDTNNYSLSSKRAVDPNYWIYQIGKVFECFPKIKFTIYQDDGWQLPKAWKYPNVKVDTISNIYYNT